jgi:hypothetical protein
VSRRWRCTGIQGGRNRSSVTRVTPVVAAAAAPSPPAGPALLIQGRLAHQHRRRRAEGGGRRQRRRRRAAAAAAVAPRSGIFWWELLGLGLGEGGVPVAIRSGALRLRLLRVPGGDDAVARAVLVHRPRLLRAQPHHRGVPRTVRAADARHLGARSLVPDHAVGILQPRPPVIAMHGSSSSSSPSRRPVPVAAAAAAAALAVIIAPTPALAAAARVARLVPRPPRNHVGCIIRQRVDR